jgi:hypothetical protein
VSILRRVLIPSDITASHRAVVRRYVEHIAELSAADWPLAIEAFNLLRHAVVVRADDRAYTFAQVYEELIDAHYATPFLKGLFDLQDVKRESASLGAVSARRIYQDLTERGLHAPERLPESRLLMAYCLYWWQSFCKGYAFEVEIFRDLERSGLRFQPHDLFDPIARRSPHDFRISGFWGDVKTSAYFLLKVSGETVSSDFFVTRVGLSTRRTRTLVVFLQGAAWDVIDGETLLSLLSDLGNVLPRPARISYHGGELVVAEYADWKAKMRNYQSARGELP